MARCGRFLAPGTVLVLVPAGDPLPVATPLRMRWGQVLWFWLAICAGTVVSTTVLSLIEDGAVDLSRLTGTLLGVNAGLAVVLGGLAVLLRRPRGGR
jgi:hypothetical protein